MITGFHHLTAITKDAEKNKTFYTDTLGLRLVKQTVNQENLTDPHFFYGDYKGTPGTILTFFELPRVGQRHEEDSFIHEVLQVGVGLVRLSGKARLATAFLREVWTARIRHPDLHRAQARHAKGVAVLLNS